MLQLHLPSSDSAVKVAPALGLYFSDSPPSDILAGVFLNSSSIDIPPRDADYLVTDEFELPVPVEVLSAFPHAHYLARTIDITATDLDGNVRSLLTIPDWQFGKQLEYRFEQAIDLAAGTRITLQADYRTGAELGPVRRCAAHLCHGRPWVGHGVCGAARRRAGLPQTG